MHCARALSVNPATHPDFRMMTASKKRDTVETEQNAIEQEPESRDTDLSSSEQGEDSELRARVEELSAELDTVRDRHMRLAAEFDNYRKRVIRERGELSTRAKAEIVETLLEAIDDLERVTATDIESAPPEVLHEGIVMVERKLIRALEAAGLEAVNAEGEPFDPELHEALMTAPTDFEEEDNLISDVLQRGYRLGQHLLRPARVRVKKYGAGDGE